MTPIEQRWDDITYHRAQIICDRIEEQRVYELVEWWYHQKQHQVCINKYESAMKVVADGN